MIYASEDWLTINFELYVPDDFIFRVHITYSALSLPLLPFLSDKNKNHNQSIRKMQIHYQPSILPEIILYGKGDLLWLFRFISREIPSELSEYLS